MCKKCNDVCTNILLRVVVWLAGRLGRTLLPVGWMMFDPTVAAAVGINEAILYAQVSGWAAHNRRRGTAQHHGQSWTFGLSYSQWQEKLHWISETTVKRCFKKLEAAGLLVGDQLAKTRGDLRKSYRPTHQAKLTPSPRQPDPKTGAKRPATKYLNSISESQFRIQTPTTPAREAAAAGPALAIMPEAVEGKDEHEPHTPSPDGTLERGGKDPTPSSAAPLPSAILDFWPRLAEAELRDMVARYGEARIVQEITYVGGRTGIQNPQGFVIAQLRKMPNARGAPADEMADGLRYVGGEYGKFIRH